MHDLKETASHIETIHILPKLPAGTFVMFQMKEGLDPEEQTELSQALFDMLEDTELRLLIIPGNFVEKLAVLHLDDLVAIKEALERAIGERHLVNSVVEA